MRSIVRLAVLFCLFVFASGCEKIGNREYGVRFWKLPPVIGGGVSSNVFQPGETVVDVPIISTIYKFDTGVRDISWGGGDDAISGFVHTRALDGNEVALAVTVSYKLTTSSEKLLHFIQQVGTSDKDVERLVKAVARADIRTYMNELRTSEFIQDSPRYRAVDEVKESMSRRLEPYGIEVLRVNLDGFHFGEIYEQKLKEIQQQREETERERARIATVLAKKEQEKNNMQARVNQIIEAAEGFRDQATARGDNYLRAKKNESEAILAAGKAEVEGLIEKINALEGPGGRAILKLEIAKELLRDNPSFVLLNEGEGSTGIAVKKLDTNDLIGQIGILEGMQKKSEQNQTSSAPQLESKSNH